MTFWTFHSIKKCN